MRIAIGSGEADVEPRRHNGRAKSPCTGVHSPPPSRSRRAQMRMMSHKKYGERNAAAGRSMELLDGAVRGAERAAELAAAQQEGGQQQ